MSAAPSKASGTSKHRSFPHLDADEAPKFEDVARLIKDGKTKRIMIMVSLEHTLSWNAS